MLEGSGASAPTLSADDADPERRALQAEAIAAIREGIEHHLTARQQQLLRAVVFEHVPLDEVVRRWSSNRNALYKLLHDARRKLKGYLSARGFEPEQVVALFAADTVRSRTLESPTSRSPL
jgi:RNA polymerase sigma-70 factor (ECF subfamily)